LKPCQQCPAGRTTTDVKSEQNHFTDCFVRDGFGVVNSTANPTDAFTFSIVGLTNTQLVNLPVLECPIGYYSEANGTSNGTAALGRKCVQCTVGSTTSEAGRFHPSQCDGECLVLL
jgi:hypothetical protein